MTLAIDALAKNVTASPSHISLPRAVDVTVKVGTGVITILIASESAEHPAGAEAVSRSYTLTVTLLLANKAVVVYTLLSARGRTIILSIKNS